MEQLKCSVCKKIRNLNEFTKDKYRLKDIDTRCKNCKSLLYKKYYTNNKTKEIDRKLNFYYKNP